MQEKGCNVMPLAEKIELEEPIENEEPSKQIVLKKFINIEKLTVWNSSLVEKVIFMSFHLLLIMKNTLDSKYVIGIMYCRGLHKDKLFGS